MLLRDAIKHNKREIAPSRLKSSFFQPMRNIVKAFRKNKKKTIFLDGPYIAMV